jgi:hypothetical protein
MCHVNLCAVRTTRGRPWCRGASLLRPSCRCTWTLIVAPSVSMSFGARADVVSGKQPEVVSRRGKQPAVVSTNDFCLRRGQQKAT